MSSFACLRTLRAVLLSAAAMAMPGPSSAQLATFDGANYSQNLLTASRELQQVTNQIQALQNEATMLSNMAKNLKTLNVSSLSQINSDLTQINSLIAKGTGLSASMPQTQSTFLTQFPTTYSPTSSTSVLASGAQARWQTTMGSYQQTLVVQSQIDQTLQSDAANLNTLLAASQSTQGGLGLALSTKQQMQLEAMMAAQYRAEAVDAARKVDAEAAGQAATTKFLGSASAYTPN
jgi:P-type conjugative transfer protein TrbJ